MKRTLLLFTLYWLTSSPLWAQFISIEDLYFPAGTAHQQVSDNQLLLTYSLKPGKEQTSLRTILYDTLMQVEQTFQTTLPFDFKVLKVTKAGDYYAHLLQSRRQAKTAVLVITDRSGNVTGQFALEGKWGGVNRMYQKATKLYGATHEPAFYLMYTKTKKQYTVLKLLHEGTLAWEYTSPIENKTAPALYVRDEKLFVFEQVALSMRKRREQVLMLNTFSGQKEASISLGSATETIRTNRLRISSGGDTLTFVGRSYPGAKLDNHHSGSLYMARYTSEGELLEEHRLSNAHKRIFWHDVVESEGKRYAIGETFRTTSFGEHLLIGVATGLATFGTFYISKATLTTKDLVIRPLNQPASLQQVHALPPSKYTIGNHLSPFIFADGYASDGAFRYRGQFGSELLLQVKDQAYTVSLAADNSIHPKLIGLLAPWEYVLFSSNRSFIAYRIDKSKNIYRLERFKIQPADEKKSTKAARL